MHCKSCGVEVMKPSNISKSVWESKKGIHCSTFCRSQSKIALNLSYLGVRIVIEGLEVKEIVGEFDCVGGITYWKIINTVGKGLSVEKDGRDVGLRFEFVMKKLGLSDFDYRKLWDSDWHAQVDGYSGYLNMLGLSHEEFVVKLKGIRSEYNRLAAIRHLPDDDYWRNVRLLNLRLCEYGKDLDHLRGFGKMERGLIRIKGMGYVEDIGIAYRLGRLAEWLGVKLDWRGLLARGKKKDYKRLLV